MKTTWIGLPRAGVGIVAATLISFISLAARAEHSCWYITTDAGLAFQSQLDWQIFGPGDFGEDKWNRRTAKFNTGYRADFHIGRRLSNGFSLELETGVAENTLANPEGIFFGHVEADLYQFPVLLNVRYEAPRWHGFGFFAAAGAGASVSMFDGRAPGDNERAFDGSFALQGTAGVNYRVCRDLDFGVSYKCLYAQEYDWTLGPGIPQKIENVFNHSVALALTWKL